MSAETLTAFAIIAAEDIDADVPPTPRAKVDEEEQEPKYPRSLQEVAAIYQRLVVCRYAS